MSDKINYLAADFDTIREELIKKLKIFDGWKDLTESSVGATLIRLFAYIADLLTYKINVIANENFLETAEIKENILKITKLLNYKTKRATPSHGEIKLFLKNQSVNSIIIPKGTKFATNDNIVFYTPFEYEIFSGEQEIKIYVVQGILNQINYISSGEKNQEIILNSYGKYYIGGDIITNQGKLKGIEILVNNEKWTETESLTYSNKNSKHYYLEPISDYALKIIFGDNELGYIPPAASNISILYNLNLGRYGNINANSITKILDNITDVEGNPVSLIIQQEKSFYNGGDPETIESIKTNAPKFFASGDRAITKDDFIAIINKHFSNILDIYISSEEDKNPPNFKEFNQITIGLLLKNENNFPLVPNENGENYLSFYENLDIILKEKIPLTVHRKYIIPKPVEILFKIKYKKNVSYTQKNTESKIKEAIEKYLQENGHIGVILKYSDLIYLIESLPEIDYCYLYFKREDDDVFRTENIQLDELEFPVQIKSNSLELIML